MNSGKMMEFIKRWREIEQTQKAIDFERSVLARDIRAEFPDGDEGDKKFTDWCAHQLGLTVTGANELLLRATAAVIVPDEKTWNVVGGYRSIRHLQDLPKRDQVNVLEAAKSTGKAILNLVKERGLGPMLPPTAPRASAPVVRPPVHQFQAPAKVVDESQAQQDAETLAKFIAKYCKTIPRDILSIIHRYSRPSVVRRSAG